MTIQEAYDQLTLRAPKRTFFITENLHTYHNFIDDTISGPRHFFTITVFDPTGQTCQDTGAYNDLVFCLEKAFTLL